MMTQITSETINKIVSRMVYQEGITANPETYTKRLSECKKCSSLRNDIMCAECGSYVAFRARVKASKCPYPGLNKWKEI